jgi:SnoaL-like domain
MSEVVKITRLMEDFAHSHSESRSHMATADMPARIANLVAELAISEAITTVQRGPDRGDLALMKSAWHDDAQVIYGFFNGAATQLCEVLMGGPAQPDNITMHRPSNVWIKINGDRAISESYVSVYTRTGDVQSLIGGRYLDRHQLRNDQWRLSHRTYVLDWNINQPATGSGLPMIPERGCWRNGESKTAVSSTRLNEATEAPWSYRHNLRQKSGSRWPSRTLRS